MSAEVRPLYWSVRRELWENRSVFVWPAVAAAVIFFGYAVSMFHFPRRVRAVLALDPAEQAAKLAMPYSVAASLIIMTGIIVGIVYCLDALHGERRDRTILFWKSLPVSDLTTVLSKAAVPLVVLPVVTFVLAMATQVAMRVLASMVLAGSGVGVSALWTQVPLWRVILLMFYGQVVFVLWHAPIWGWLLLVSSWARRMPFLWAVLPPLALGLFVRIAFQSSYVCTFIADRVMGAMPRAFVLKPEDKHQVLRLSQLDPLGYLASPGLWFGLAFAAFFIFKAAQLRRRRDPI
jgi:ABC-2 type transport system permease protein